MEQLYLDLSNAIVNMDEEKALLIANEITERQLDIQKAVELGVVGGMTKAGELYDREEYFIPDLLGCVDAMDAAMTVLKPALSLTEYKSKGRVVIGTVFGDTHDIGKNIVAIILEGGGYEVFDLGRNVSAEDFVENAMRFNADIIAMSTLMTTTMSSMGDVIRLLEKENKRHLFKVIIGGKPVSKAFAQKIGADGYSATATGAFRLIKNLLLNE